MQTKEGRDLLRHSGGMIGFVSFVRADMTNGLGVVALMNGPVEVSHGAAWYFNKRYTGPRRFATPEAWSAYVGRYRSFSPWFPYFEVVVNKDRLLAITGEGGETSSGATVLVPAGGAMFRVGDEITPETLRFEEIGDGRALEAVWSGHAFFRQ